MARELAATHWRIVATIRTLDLKHGRRWRTMFPGQPVIRTAADPELTGVRHVLVADLTEQELVALRAHSPRMATLLDAADPRLRRLLANPFNLDIAGQLLAEANADLTTIHSRVDLLDRYWELRVTGDKGGIERNRAVQAAVHEMVGKGRQAVRPIDLPAAQATSAALYGLQHDGVLRALPRRPGTADSQLAFTHPVLFDYAVALFGLGDPDRPDSFAEIFDRDPNLTITVRPSLKFRLATIWRLALRLTPEADGHPLAAAARGPLLRILGSGSFSLRPVHRLLTRYNRD